MKALQDLVEEGISSGEQRFSEDEYQERSRYPLYHIYINFERTGCDAIFDVGNPINHTSIRPIDSRFSKPYICLNPDNGLHGKSGNVTYYRYDGLDFEAINKIIKEENLKNPLYLVKDAIGIILTYFTSEWVGENVRDAEDIEKINSLSKKMAEIWAENLTKMNIKSALMVDSLDTKSTYFYGKFGSITKPLYDYFKEQLAKRGWNIKDYALYPQEKYEEKILLLERGDTLGATNK